MKSQTSAPRSRKLPARYAGVLMPLVLSVIMTFVVSGISTVMSLGVSPAFLSVWPRAWGFSWLVAFPTLLVVLPIVRQIIGLLVEAPSMRHR